MFCFDLQIKSVAFFLCGVLSKAARPPLFGGQEGGVAGEARESCASFIPCFPGAITFLLPETTQMIELMEKHTTFSFFFFYSV